MGTTRQGYFSFGPLLAIACLLLTQTGLAELSAPASVLYADAIVGAATPEAAPELSSFGGLVPARLMDSRVGYVTVDGGDAGGGVRVAGSVTELQVAGRGGVPADAAAAVLNLAVTEAQGSGFVTVWPCGEAMPTAANLNFVAGQTVANAVVATVGAGGKVCVYTYAATHVIVDVNAYFPAGASFGGLVPARLMDSRVGYVTVDGGDAGGGVRVAGSVTELQVAGRGGVPADAAAAVLNLAVTEAQGSGFVTVWPCGEAMPTAANLNFVAGQTVANAVVATVGAGGKVCVYTYAATHVIVDVNAYFPAASDVLEGVSHPSATRLGAGNILISGGVQLRDELWITIGTPSAPGSLAEAERVAAGVAAQIVGGFELFGIYQLRWPAAIDLAAMSALIEDMSGGIDATPSIWGDLGEADLPPGDFDDDGPAGTWQFDRIGAPAAWSMTKGTSVTVGIVDGGTAFRGHEDLDVTFPPGHPLGEATHATHVAGLACAKANGKGLVGAAWGCPILSVGIASGSAYDIFAAALTALDSGAQIINMSLGKNYFDSSGHKRCATQEEADADRSAATGSAARLFFHLFDSAKGRKVLWTLAAGNNCVSGVQSPMAVAAEDYALSNVLIVSATNSDDSLASFSNFPSGSDGQWIAAPGGVSVAPIGDGTVGVWSTSFTTCVIWFHCGTYEAMSGTSMAAPIVAGVAALVRELHPDKSAAEVAQCIVRASELRGNLVVDRSIYPTYRVPTSDYPDGGTGTALLSAPDAVTCAPVAPLPTSGPCAVGRAPTLNDLEAAWGRLVAYYGSHPITFHQEDFSNVGWGLNWVPDGVPGLQETIGFAEPLGEGCQLFLVGDLFFSKNGDTSAPWGIYTANTFQGPPYSFGSLTGSQGTENSLLKQGHYQVATVFLYVGLCDSSVQCDSDSSFWLTIRRPPNQTELAAFTFDLGPLGPP